MAENKREVLVGAGHVYKAAVNTPMPDDFDQPALVTDPTPGPWTYLGFTEGGVSIERNLSKIRVGVDQKFSPVKIVTTERVVQVTTTLAQINATNLQQAYGGGTITPVDPDSTPDTGDEYEEFTPPAVGEEVSVALLFAGANPNGDHARFYAPEATVPDGASATQFQKGDKATIAMAWELVEPDAGDPFIWRTKPEPA